MLTELRSLASYTMYRRPRVVLVAIAALLLTVAGLTAGLLVKSADADRWEARTEAAEATVRLQNESLGAVVALGKERAKLADKAIALAAQVGKADRAAAEAYLRQAQQTPAGDLCVAAQQLVDQAVRENR